MSKLPSVYSGPMIYEIHHDQLNSILPRYIYADKNPNPELSIYSYNPKDFFRYYPQLKKTLICLI